MEHIKNMTRMMAGSLGLEEPWHIIGAEFNEKELALHIHVGIRKTAAIVCPHCGAQTKRNGYEPKERIWRHGDVMFYPCLVHCRRPKVLCPHCGSVQVNAPFERKNSRFTLLFEGYAMLILADMPISKTSTLLRCDEKSLVKIMRHWINKAVDGMDLRDVVMLAIDETSFKRGHKYVTLVIDALDEVRKAEQKTSNDKRALFRGRRLFMIPESKLTAGQSVKLAEMSKRYPQTGRAYRIVAGLDDFYSSQTMTEAEEGFDSLYSWMRRCRLTPMKAAAETLKRHKDKILAYFKNRITNAICEGINSMIQAAKRKARGFHTFEGYSAMIYLVAGKLELAVPKPF